jgi:predicted CxxxxCH...CXXCH cytochrome family protein
VKGIWIMLLFASCADERVLSGPCDGDCTTDVHAPGILDPASPNFHATVLRQLNWGFAICAGCHGSDFSGGTSHVSCLGCHTAGPTACVTCHGAGPTSNAHGVHAMPGIPYAGGSSVACGECHIVPATWDADGHIVHDGIAITTPATVTFGARAALTIDPADRAGPPAYDVATATCTNVYCHGGELHAAAGADTSPRWTEPAPPAGECTSCHGHPPPNHIAGNCTNCHPSGSPHIDGIVQVGTACNSCHGSATSNAPPMDLEGNQFTTAIGVGAHQAHLQASSHISAPIPCATCHLVPTAVDSPGHIDMPPPAVVTAALGWDHDAQTCASSYCHGTSRPVWTSTGQVFCGSCHGIPPSDAPHTPAMTLTSCASCHPGTVDAFGNIIVTNGTSEHINGHVDL